MPNNPILEANPASLDKLFADDPLNLSDADLELIIREERKARLAREGGARVSAKKPKEKITLADLGL